jgi:CheY-like chemotaxis protein
MSGDEVAIMAPSSAQSLCILVVDNDHDAADSFALALQLLGHQARAVYKSQEALTAAAVNRPDLLLLEPAPPGLDEHPVLMQLKTDPLLEGVPVIVVTGNATEAERQKSLAAGCVAFLAKPVDFPGLEVLLGQVARRQR